MINQSTDFHSIQVTITLRTPPTLSLRCRLVYPNGSEAAHENLLINMFTKLDEESFLSKILLFITSPYEAMLLKLLYLNNRDV